jgi:hypothetical protein
MATQPSPWPLTSPATQSHGFFKSFARELRDHVYELLYQDVTREVAVLQHHTRTKISVLRLVSRDFKDEYDEWCSKDKQINQLTVTDTYHVTSKFNFCLCESLDEYDLGRLAFPGHALHITKLAVTLTACNGDHEETGCIARCRIKCHEEWISALMHNLPHLQHVHIELMFPGGLCVSEGLEDSLGLLTTLPKIVELKTISPEAESGSASGSVTLATWTREHGLQKNHEAIKRSRE